jgi:hypothetical protein
MVRVIVVIVAVSERDQLLGKILIWIILLGQWPLHMSWILQVIEDDEQSDNFFSDGKNGDKTLYDIYKTVVENRVFSMPTDPALAEYYSKLLSLDHDPEVFDKCLKQCGLKRSDLGGFSARSKNDLLSFTQILNPSLQFFLAKISAHREDADVIQRRMRVKYASRSAKAFSLLQPQDFSTDQLKKWLIKNKFAHDSVLGDKVLQNVDQREVDGKVMERIVGDGVRQAPLEALTTLGITCPLDQEIFMTRWIENSKIGVSPTDLLQTQPDLDVGAMIGSIAGLITDATAAGDGEDKDSLKTLPEDSSKDPAKDPQNDSPQEPTDSEAAAAAAPADTVNIAKRTTDDKTGKDHVGYLMYAVVLAMLVFEGISTPIVFGLYANWGTGKSFIMNKVFF